MLESLWYELASRSGGWLAVVAVGALKGAVILAVTALVALSLRRGSAAVRHQVWLVGVVCALVVPLLGIVLPRFTVPGPAWLADRAWEGDWTSYAGYADVEMPVEIVASPEWAASVHAQAEAGVAALASHLDGLAAQVAADVAVLGTPHVVPPSITMVIPPVPPVAPIPSLPPLPPLPPTPSAAPLPSASFAPHAFSPVEWGPGPFEAGGFPWALLALGVWLSGVWLVSAGIVVGALRVAWIGWQARPVGTGRCSTLATAIADELGLADVRVLLGSSTAMPMTWGLFRTTVLLPDGADSWPVDQLDAVLRHELAHARRRDTVTQLIADVGCAVYWFNPLAWAAAFRLRVEREHACDDEVIASGSKPSDYATQLLDMTRALRTARATAMAAIPMARPSQLRGRLEAVLDENRTRGTLTRPARVRGWLLGLALAVPIAMLGFAPVPSFADEYDFDPDAYFDSEMIAPYVDEAVGHAVAGAFEAHTPWPPEPMIIMAPVWQECADSRRNNSFSQHVDDDEQRIQWYTDGCLRRVEIDGEIHFDDDFRRIESLSSGTRIRIEAETRRGERAVDIRSVNGDITYAYSEDGDERPFDEEARAWLDALVLELLRTGYAAEERVAALLQRGGAAAVLAEVDHLHSDYARRIYYQAALAEESVSPSQAVSLIERARAMRSDYDLAELLIATADDRPFSGAIRSAFIDASASLSSDYERRRVLAVVLASPDLSPDNVAAVLASASEIRSDYEKTELLVTLTNRDLSSPEVQHAYVEAAGIIGSDYERRRALEAILVKNELDPAVMALAIRTAAALRSDHDKAETLLNIARTQTLDEASRAEFLQAIETLRSDHDHGRVSSALLRSGR